MVTTSLQAVSVWTTNPGEAGALSPWTLYSGPKQLTHGLVMVPQLSEGNGVRVY